MNDFEDWPERSDEIGTPEHSIRIAEFTAGLDAEDRMPEDKIDKDMAQQQAQQGKNQPQPMA